MRDIVVATLLIFSGVFILLSFNSCHSKLAKPRNRTTIVHLSLDNSKNHVYDSKQGDPSVPVLRAHTASVDIVFRSFSGRSVFCEWSSLSKTRVVNVTNTYFVGPSTDSHAAHSILSQCRKPVPEQVKQVLTNLEYRHDHDLLSFLLGLYFQTDYVIVINMDSVNIDHSSRDSILVNWIQRASERLLELEEMYPKDEYLITGCYGEKEKQSFSSFPLPEFSTLTPACLAVSQRTIRYLISNTTLTMSSPSLFKLLPRMFSCGDGVYAHYEALHVPQQLIDNAPDRRRLSDFSMAHRRYRRSSQSPQQHAQNSNLMNTRVPSSGDCKHILLPRQLKCEAHSKVANSNQSFDHRYNVYLRTYRRNYLSRQVNQVMTQSVLPQSIVVVQNGNQTLFDFDFLQRNITMSLDRKKSSSIRGVDEYDKKDLLPQSIKLFYVKNLNWNAFFLMSYILSAVSDVEYSFTYDDDQLLSDVSTHSHILRELNNNRNQIVSLRPWCWCKKYMSKTKDPNCKCNGRQDMAVNPIFMQSSLAKYTWRYSIATYYCCEEMSLSLTSFISCGTVVNYMGDKLKYESYQQDNQHRSLDPFTIELKKRVNWETIENQAMDHYMRAGYRPVNMVDPMYQNVTLSVFPL